MKVEDALNKAVAAQPRIWILKSLNKHFYILVCVPPHARTREGMRILGLEANRPRMEPNIQKALHLNLYSFYFS